MFKATVRSHVFVKIILNTFVWDYLFRDTTVLPK